MATIVRGKNANKPWTVRYQHEGRQREKSFRTKTEANDFIAKFEHDSREHIFVDPREANVKFRDAAEQWVSGLTGAESSKAFYRRTLENHINPKIGNWSLRHVAGDRYGIEHLLKKTLPEKGLGPSSVAMCYTVIRATVNNAMKAGKLNNSRINGISLPDIPHRADIVFPSYHQLSLMADQMPENWGLALWLMRGCGLRIGEALAVRYENFKGGVLRITEQMLADGSYGPLKHRKRDDFRDVPVPGYVLDKLDFPSDPEVYGARFGYVFPKVSRRTFYRWFALARGDAGLPDTFTPHTLRHVFASVSLSNGVPITDVSKWLGHSNINMTYSIYGHLVPSSWWKARHILDDEYAIWKGTTDAELAQQARD